VQIEDSHHWFFEEATIYHFDPDFPAAPARVEHLINLRQTIADESEAALMAADADTLPLRTLLEYIEARPSAERVRRLRADLHERLAEPLVTLLFALLAVPIGLRAEESKNLALPAVYGIVTVAAFYLLRGTTATLASEGVLSATLAPWSLLGIFTLWGSWTLLRVHR
jgi:lipopolysaccharide export system permease protein